MVGLFINTLPLRVRLPPGKPLRELLAEVQESQSRLMAHQHLGLAEIQGLAGLGELFDTLVVFENYPVDRAGLAAEAGGLRLTDFSGHDATHYPLSLAAMPGERLQLRLDYRPDLFERASVEAMAERLVRLLEAAVADAGAADRHGSTFSAPTERRTILREWNDTARAVPSATLPELFAAQVARTPDAVAVVFEERALSYGELDARANQLAHHLRALGVGPEVVVGLCVERSLEMLVGLLGILKAGGAYLPLDPTTRPSGSPSCWRMPARRCWSRTRRCSSDCLQHRRPRRVPRCRLADHRGAARHRARRRAPARKTPPMSSTPQAPPEHQKASWSTTATW